MDPLLATIAIPSKNYHRESEVFNLPLSRDGIHRMHQSGLDKW